MPHVVAKEIISILRKFLYVVDDEEKRKIYWDRVCCLKGHGWLGIKNIYLFNIALMENGDGLCFVSKKFSRSRSHEKVSWNTFCLVLAKEVGLKDELTGMSLSKSSNPSSHN